MNEPNESAPAREAAARAQLVSDLPSPRRPVTLAILSLWLVGWAFGVGFMVQQLFEPGPFGFDRAFLLAWLLVWVAAGALVVGYIAWLAAGRERVTLEDGALVLRRGLFGMWWTRRWPLGSIRRLRTFGREIPPMIAFGLDVAGRGASGVRFESRGEVVRFARTLDEHEARAVVNRLRALHEFEPEAPAEPHERPHSQPAA